MNRLVVDLSLSRRMEITTSGVTVGHTEDIPEPYSGPYTVTPEKNRQTLSTSGKSMSEDVTVLGIPYREYTNETGGITAVIGGDA